MGRARYWRNGDVFAAMVSYWPSWEEEPPWMWWALGPRFRRLSEGRSPTCAGGQRAATAALRRHRRLKGKP